MPWRENKGVCQFKRILDGNKIFNKNPWPKCARIPRFWEGFYYGSPTARIFGAARAENKSKNLFFAESREK